MRKSIDLIMGAEFGGTFVPDNHGCTGRSFATDAFLSKDQQEDVRREARLENQPRSSRLELVSEDLDPEAARAIIDPALKLMIDAAHRYDGYVV